LYFCLGACGRLHASVGGRGHCPRLRKGRDFIIADYGPAPAAILQADATGRLTADAQFEILRTFERLDRALEKEIEPTPELPSYRT